MAFLDLRSEILEEFGAFDDIIDARGSEGLHGRVTLVHYDAATDLAYRRGRKARGSCVKCPNLTRRDADGRRLNLCQVCADKAKARITDEKRARYAKTKREKYRKSPKFREAICAAQRARYQATRGKRRLRAA